MPENYVRMETMLIDKMDKMGIEVFVLRENIRLYRLDDSPTLVLHVPHSTCDLSLPCGGAANHLSSLVVSGSKDFVSHPIGFEAYRSTQEKSLSESTVPRLRTWRGFAH